MKCILVAAMLLWTSSCWAQATPSTPPSRHVETVEDRIKSLHSELKITPAEEAKWSKVADAMRSNAKAIDTLLEQRHENAGKETAVDNLRSWSELAQAHADGSKALLDAFESLYADMPDAQKKVADDAFRPAEPHAK
jgi:periplasmic protein CpxP/Spy